LEGISVSIWEWEEPEVEQWREADAVRLLQEVGATVAGTTPPDRGYPSNSLLYQGRLSSSRGVWVPEDSSVVLLARIIHERLRRTKKEHAISFVRGAPRPDAAALALPVP
jgi:hypothetical protein